MLHLVAGNAAVASPAPLAPPARERGVYRIAEPLLPGVIVYLLVARSGQSVACFTCPEAWAGPDILLALRDVLDARDPIPDIALVP